MSVLKIKRPKRDLFLLAGILWSIGGFMVLKLGLTSWKQYNNVLINSSVVIIFIFFYQFIFSRLVKKHEKRILNYPQERMYWYQFFDTKSYIIMFTMMSLGIILRHFQLMKISFYSYFYTGLGFALFLCGLKFLWLSIKHKGVN